VLPVDGGWTAFGDAGDASSLQASNSNQRKRDKYP
jgi:hypothetical protein